MPNTLRILPGGSKKTVYESKYQILFDQASDAIITVLPTGEIDEVNQAFQEMTGYMKEELTNLPVKVLVPDAKSRHIPERVRPLEISFFKSPGTYEDTALLRKDGYVRLVDLSVRQVKSGGKVFSLGLFRDVTEKKRMERELITKHGELRNAYAQLEKNNLELKAMQGTLVQAGKMAALGELSAGIAHELNQPLQAIRGYTQEISSILEPALHDISHADEIKTHIHEVISNVDKMKDIIQYLRTFTRKSTEKHEKADLHHSLDESLKMLSQQFRVRGIEVVKKYEKNLPTVYANPIALEQVFINLASNARDAIEATGRGNGKIVIKTKSSGNFIEVSFKDDGCGMNERTKSKAFNPFFTTKEVGKGMGMGLSMSYGILNKLQGSIIVNSEAGKGTEFIVRLPQDFREVT